MWPMRLDMTRDECRKCLRCLELDAYGSMVSVLRAQGPFTSQKQKLLQELAKVLHISNERHRAEVRRAVNDEKLATIAEQLNGPNTGTDWTIEGRRAIPLLPRLKARSAFTTLANSLSLAASVANERRPVPVKTEDVEDTETESQVPMKLIEKLPIITEQTLDDKRRSEEAQMSKLGRNEEIIEEKIKTEPVEEILAPEKRKSPSPLPLSPPNKVLVVSPSSAEVINHDSDVKESLENNVSHTIVNVPQHQNVTLIPLSVSSVQSSSTASKDVNVEDSVNTLVQCSKQISATISTCTPNVMRQKARITTAQTRVLETSPKIVLPSNLSNLTGVNVSQAKDAQIHSSINTKLSAVPHSSLKVTKPKPANLSASCIKRITPLVHSNNKPTIASKSVVSSDTHRVMTICPGNTVSSGPGPPSVKQTTLTCKKLSPAVLNHQSAAKVAVTLNSNKTLNISHHPTKLASKTNVIVIQKGHTKGVTLSHAGKEVLGKVIMGGKNLCVTNQHGASSVNVPHHTSLNNGDQSVTVLSSVNSSQSETVKSNVKSGSTIVFNLRQDVLEKSKTLSQLLESSSVLTSESKAVIQHTNTHLTNEEHNSNSYVIDNESLKIDTVVTSAMEENQHRKSKDVHTNANFHVTNSVDTTKSSENEEILISSDQLTSMQDDIVSNIQIEDSVCNSEIDVFETSLESTDSNFETFQYFVEDSENHVLKETRSPILSASQINDDNS